MMTLTLCVIEHCQLVPEFQLVSEARQTAEESDFRLSPWRASTTPTRQTFRMQGLIDDVLQPGKGPTSKGLADYGARSSGWRKGEDSNLRTP